MTTEPPLWAPWRLPYIVSTKETRPEGCFLCQYASEPAADAVHQVVIRTELTLTVLNRFPYNNGHLLVAPLRHQATLGELTEPELLECARTLRDMTQVLGKLLAPEGFNIGLNQGRVAGAGLPGHLHWHIVPRWTGDTNFMPVLAGINVIPQSLEALYDLLRQELRAAAPGN